ncbi:MAG: phosphatidylglycerol lysyltransferase domain-containing protein [Candidatus Pseudobacter hemicellulosilyticus]|uniref:Phosphatidylglycerol lysyltransferase n=1 Tax=Candidatus Pseudobacter hemicellulosilyticus TaxID=3121375 RepID=A0AAJ5WN72_9BACT|nr:MAG: phosphatidylglycerol lysyltransferase domain-containing protein [Pseudobacter sp.]
MIKRFSPRAYWKEALAILVLLLAIVFFRSERKELSAIGPQLKQADLLWVVAGILTSFLFVFFQGGMYRQSFAAIGHRLSFVNAIVLFLKRNFLSVFLPAGGVSALAYTPSRLRKAGYPKMAVRQASGLFAFAGLLTVFIVGLPVVFYAAFRLGAWHNAAAGLLVLLVLILLLAVVARSLKKKGWLYQQLSRRFPRFAPEMEELFAANVHPLKFTGAVIYSVGVELSGILTLLIAMKALGLPASVGAAAIAYIIAVLMMVVSPFLRGLGAVELSMVYFLEQSGYSAAQALSITALYRIFEFWLPLVLGLFAFAWKGKKLFLRVFPVLLTFGLGLVNILSAITPPLHRRLSLLREYLPLDTIHASNLLVLFMGLLLLVTAAFLFRGLRAAWAIALLLSGLSLIGHLTKALDYEEAAMAALTVIVLLITASQYRIRSSLQSLRTGLLTAGICFIAVTLFAFISFYFIDQRHFGVDFTWQQSLEHAGKMFLLLDDPGLQPRTHFGQEFIWLVRIPALATWALLVFFVTRPVFQKQRTAADQRARAIELVRVYGSSSLDHFKLLDDKQQFFSAFCEGLLAYGTAGGFAIVLEGPVCAAENRMDLIGEFEQFCRGQGLKPAYYRVDQDDLGLFAGFKKQKLMLGQEAIVDLQQFSMEGKDRKSLRNGISGLQKKGYVLAVHQPPHSAAMLDQLQRVSDEWLLHFQQEELGFSQGWFDKGQLQEQVIITLAEEAGAVKAFLNCIPDYAEDEITYDLIRKTDDAPGAAMDALIVKLIDYAQGQGKQLLNLGLAPMTGITAPDNTPEQLINLAAQKIKRFRHYQGLRDFKEKYASIWENKYLVYDSDFDLLQLPVALNRVMKRAGQKGTGAGRTDLTP